MITGESATIDRDRQSRLGFLPVDLTAFRPFRVFGGVLVVLAAIVSHGCVHHGATPGRPKAATDSSTRTISNQSPLYRIISLCDPETIQAEKPGARCYLQILRDSPCWSALSREISVQKIAATHAWLFLATDLPLVPEDSIKPPLYASDWKLPVEDCVVILIFETDDRYGVITNVNLAQLCSDEYVANGAEIFAVRLDHFVTLSRVRLAGEATSTQITSDMFRLPKYQSKFAGNTTGFTDGSDVQLVEEADIGGGSLVLNSNVLHTGTENDASLRMFADFAVKEIRRRFGELGKRAEK